MGTSIIKRVCSSGRPQFIVVHLVWFIVWILVNEGYIESVNRFDAYPYGLLGIILAIEAVLITGFVLISQNYQYDYSEKRAELDYEINIRTYHKLIKLEQRLKNLTVSPEEKSHETL